MLIFTLTLISFLLPSFNEGEEPINEQFINLKLFISIIVANSIITTTNIRVIVILPIIVCAFLS